MKEAYLKAIGKFLSLHKIPTIIIASAVVASVLATTIATHMINTPKKSTHLNSSNVVSDASSEDVSSEETSVTSEPASSETSSVPVVSSKPITSNQVSAKPTVKPQANKPIANGGYKYNTNSNIDDNVFLDALIYTGYNINKHRSDGMMWQYVLASQKRGKGWLSKIGYAGGSSGYETVNGKPNIKHFEKRGLVCASYVTYVYFNYLPNVAGIDTSSLARPVKSYSANDWYIAAKQWVASGQSRKIGFNASKTSSGFINFKPNEEIPIGSIIAFCDARHRSDHCSHVVIYAGYKNNYHWVTHVGNDNGPEFCAVERMHFGPDPQWPIAVITPPSNIRMSALLEVNVKDESGAPIAGASVTAKNTKTGQAISLGTTSAKGTVSKEGLSYGAYTVSYTVPDGYLSNRTSVSVNLTTVNNSKNTVNVVLNKKPVAPPPSVPSEAGTSSSASSSVSSTESSSVSSESSQTVSE